MAQEGCEKPWLHRHGIQTCSLPLQHHQCLHKYHPATAKAIFLVLSNFGKGCCSAAWKMSFPCLQMEILSSNVHSQMFLSSLMLSQWHSKTDLFWLWIDHPLSPQENCSVFHVWDSTHHGALLLWVPLFFLSLLWSSPVADAPSPSPLLPLNPFSAYFAVSITFHQQGCSPAPLESWERRSHPLMLEDPPCSPSSAVLSQFSKSFSLCHLSLSIHQRTILKYFWLCINPASFMTYFSIQDVNVAAVRVQEIPVTLMHSN